MSASELDRIMAQALHSFRHGGNENNNACRLIHGVADGWPGFYLDRLGAWLLAQSPTPVTPREQAVVENWLRHLKAKGAYHKQSDRHLQRTGTGDVSPRHFFGQPAPKRFPVSENGLRFLASFEEGYSVGLFLDQRENRKRILHNRIVPGFPVFSESPAGAGVLNVFSYTCGFSVCAAKAGTTTVSLDLSQKNLDWGRENFRLNNIDPEEHDFIYGDAFDWLKRLVRRGRLFDLIILDPPTFSRSKKTGTFQVVRDYGTLVELALPLLRRGGMLLACSNAATLKPFRFQTILKESIRKGGRRMTENLSAPQPPDFPVVSGEHAHLKAVWLHVE